MNSTAKTAMAAAAILMTMTGRATAQSPVLIGFDDGEAKLAVRRAVEGASARLARPGCREVLSDFTDDAGERLELRLLANGRSPAQALARVRFFDDRTAPHCRAGTAMAFTHPGSQVIRVCGREFAKRNREAAEIILIHEFLHALGLGENPPTSAAITEQVDFRCGADKAPAASAR